MPSHSSNDIEQQVDFDSINEGRETSMLDSAKKQKEELNQKSKGTSNDNSLYR